MYKRLSAILFPVATLLFLGAIFWGYQEHQEKNSILIKAENQYQRAFHDLSFHVDKLHSELGNTLAVNSASHGFQRKGLINVWRLTSEAQSEINQLPLTLLPFNKTEELLSHVSKFSYRTAVRDLTKNPLTKDELKTLKTLHANTAKISKDLRSVQDKVIKSNLRWMDVETALATERNTLDNTIIDGFKTVDKKVGEYPEINWGPSMASLHEKRDIKALGGKLMTAEEIKHKAAQFMGAHDTSNMHVKENGNGSEFASFSVTMKKPNSHDDVQLDFAKYGGDLIYFMDSRSVDGKKLSVADAQSQADSFLKHHGYHDMRAVSYDEYHNVGTLTYAGVQGDVVNYNKKLTVRVALDNGDVTGMQATDYIFEQKPKQLKVPAMTSKQARKTLNPEFKTTQESKALIKNELGQEVLCYEYMGSINGDNYRIFINADNGIEEMIERVSPAEKKLT